MALGPREFVEEVEKYFDIIQQKIKNKRAELNIPSVKRVKFAQINLDDVKNDIIEITVSLHRLFIAQQSIDNLSASDTDKLIKKARFIALAGVTLMFKEYNNKDDSNFWQFYSREVGLSVNDNFYFRILEPALIDEGIIRDNVTRIDSYTDIIAREADISESSLEDIIYLFGVYKKYFYPNLQIKEFFRDINDKNSHNILNSFSTSVEKSNISSSYLRLTNFKEKVISVLHDLAVFTNYILNQPIFINKNNFDEYIKNYQKDYDCDIGYAFKTDNLKNKFLELFQSVEIHNFINILKNEDVKTVITLPDNNKTTVEELLNSNELVYGNYKVNDQIIDLSVNSVLSSSALTNIERDKITVFGNKVIIRSFHPFEVSIGQFKSLHQAVKLFKDGKFEGYIWYDNKPLFDDIEVESEKVEFESLEASENIISCLNTTLINQHTKPQFNLCLEYLLLVSKENKGKKAEIISNDQTTIKKDFMIDNVGYSGHIAYPIKNKYPGMIYLYLTADKEQPLSLKEFEPRLSYELEECMLFDGRLKTKISPSDKSIEYAGSKLYLFTVSEFQNYWVNEVCEVSSFQNFGAYNVYEIEWIEKDKPLQISIDQHFSWTILHPLELSIDSKDSQHHNKFIEYKNNLFHNLKDIHLSLYPKENNINLKELEIKTCYNYDIVSSNLLFGLINHNLGRDENNNLIDESFIKLLIPNYKNLSYGRYDFEFSHKCCLIGKFTAFVIPELNVEERNDVYLEGDDITLKVTSNVPCFRNGKTSQNYLFDYPAKCNISLNENTKLIEVKKTKYIKVAKLYNPYTEINIKYEPEVIGYRFMVDNRFYSSDMIDYYSLDKTSFTAKTFQRDVRLKINGNVIKDIVPNNSGIILEPLKSSKEYISRNTNDVTIQMGKHELNFQVIWNTIVSKLAPQNMVYSVEDGISFLLSYEGANHSQLRFVVTDDSGKSIDVKKIICDDEVSPKFVRFDRQKGCVFINCDGKKWENRVFHFQLDAKSAENTENIYLEGFNEDNRESFGKIIFRNENSNPDLKELNERIKSDSDNPYSYFERGFLYSEMNEFLLAEKDFEKSLKLGLDDEEATNYIDVFKESLANNLLTYELSQITRLAKKLYTDELLLELE